MNDLGDADSYLPAGAFNVIAPRAFPPELMDVQPHRHRRDAHGAFFFWI